MNHSELQLRSLSDPRLAVHATSALPVWLWSADGTRILWANPVGARAFGAANNTGLASKTFGPADAHRRQIARLAGRLPPNGAIRLERLRGFGAPLGMLMTCGCARLDFSDGGHGILVVAHAGARTMPLAERLRRLVEGVDLPIAAFAPDGVLVGASDAARPLLSLCNLSEADFGAARNAALRQGRIETPTGIGHMVLQRVGRGADVALVALIVPNAATAQKHQAAHEEAALGAVTSKIDTQNIPTNEPSPTNEAVAAEPAEPSPSKIPSWLGEASLKERQHPLRFVWRIDTDGRFLLGAGEFTDLIGARTAAGLRGSWSEIAKTFNLDPDGRIAKAIARHEIWSGITLNWPADGGERLPVELAGLPVFDRMREFAGYRGYGVCRDLDALTRLAALRRFEFLSNSVAPQRLSAEIVQFNSAQDLPAQDFSAQDFSAQDFSAQDFSAQDLAAQNLPAANSPAKSDMTSPIPTELPARVAVAVETSPSTDLEKPVDLEKPSDLEKPQDLEKPLETPPNVVPFRPVGEPKSPTLTPVENNAFDELARQLSARLHHDNDGSPAATPEATEAVTASFADSLAEPQVAPPAPEPLNDPRPSDAPANQDLANQDSANELPGSEHPEWLAEPEPPARGEAQRDRTLLDLLPTGILIYRLDRLLYANPAFLRRIGYASLYALEQAGGLDALYVEAGVSSASSTSEAGTPMTISASQGYQQATAPGNGQANEAEASSSIDARLFTISWDGESALALICLPARAAPAVAAAAEAGPTDPVAAGHADAEDLAVIRDTTAEGIVMFDAKGEGDLQQARRQADLAANAKAEMLTRISHEVRTPLNAIIDFADVMVGERFGALGNERYVEYIKDIRSSTERVIAIIDDLLELSRIETGKLDLTFADQNLNDLVEACVAVMQPQANRERIIIRSSLSHALPPVVADAGALRQITLNLIGNSIHLANAGGQVIVSTALSDLGDVVLRVRDSGPGLNDNEVAAALEPFRTVPPSDEAPDSPPVNLSLTKALVEANRAQFHIKTAARSGTLIEVVFSDARAPR